MAMAAMNMVSAGGYWGASFHLRRRPQWVASVLCKITPIFGSRQSKLDHLTVSVRFQAVKRELIQAKCRKRKHSSEWARCEEAVGTIYFVKKWNSETLKLRLEFDNFKPRLKSCIFECSRGWTVLFLIYPRFWTRYRERCSSYSRPTTYSEG